MSALTPFRPSSVKALIVIEFLVGILGIIIGGLLSTDPTGRIGSEFLVDFMPIDYLALVGMFLLVVFGLVPIMVGLGLWARMRWAWVVAWILAGVELFWVGWSVGQGILGITALSTPYTIAVTATYFISISTIYLLIRPTLRTYLSQA